MTLSPARSVSLPALALLCGIGIAHVSDAQQFVQQTATRFPSPNPAEWTNQITIGDLDGDDDLDIVFANGGNFSSPGTDQLVRVYFNDGAGFFSDGSVGATGGITGLHRGVELGDVEGDGDLDMILVQDFARPAALLINDGSGSFTNEGAARLPAINLSSSRAQFGDVDNDGDLDLFIVSGTNSRFDCGQYRLYLNDGAGFFSDVTGAQFPLGNECENMDCIFGDIDGDFDLDIRTASTGTANSRLYRNDGAGAFTLDSSPPADSTAYSYDFGDIDGDGDLDLLGTNAGSSNTERLLVNDGTGLFTDATSQLLSNPNIDDNDSKFFDYDNDGDLDLLIGALGGSAERIYNNSSGVFTLTSGVISAQSDSTLDVMVADLTGNGRLDIVTGQGESGNFQNRIYVNTTGPADTIPPSIVATEQVRNTESEGPHVVRAAVLDQMTSDRNFFDKGVELNYSVNGGAAKVAPMTHSGGQIYRGEVPEQPAGSAIDYWISATDFAGNTGTGEVQSFNVLGGLPLIADVNELFASVGGVVSFRLRAGTEHAGRTFILLATTAGTTPAYISDGIVLPFNLAGIPSPSSGAVAAQNTVPKVSGNAPKPRFFRRMLIESSTVATLIAVGGLDAEGTTNYQLVVPPDPSLAGITTHYAYLVVQNPPSQSFFSTTGITLFASNAVPIDLMR